MIIVSSGCLKYYIEHNKIKHLVVYNSKLVFLTNHIMEKEYHLLAYFLHSTRMRQLFC